MYPTVSATRPIQVGDEVTYRSIAAGGPVLGIVVRVHRGGVAHNNPTIDVYSFADRVVRSFYVIGGDWARVRESTPEQAAGNVAAALEDYKALLATYPVWAERFANGFKLTF